MAILNAAIGELNEVKPIAVSREAPINIYLGGSEYSLHFLNSLVNSDDVSRAMQIYS